MKPYNSLLSSEDIRIHVPRTDCHGGTCRNDSHLYNTNRRTHEHEHATSYGQVNFMGEAMKSTEHRSRNPPTWELLK
jgi:hypothetical protein